MHPINSYGRPRVYSSCHTNAAHVGTIVVHFMTEEARSKYELEKLWTLGPRYDDQYRNMEHIIENNP